MSNPLKGKWKIRRSDNAADAVLPTGSLVEIRVRKDGTYRVTSPRGNGKYTWTPHFVSEDDRVIYGKIDSIEYGFVISIGVLGKARGLYGIIYKIGGSGEDEDPGTWVADEDGVGGSG